MSFIRTYNNDVRKPECIHISGIDVNIFLAMMTKLMSGEWSHIGLKYDFPSMYVAFEEMIERFNKREA